MADFEREEARPWKEWMKNSLPSREQRSNARPIVFPTEPETEARASWRRNDKAQGKLVLPRDLNLQGQGQKFKRHFRNADNLLFDRFPFLKEIAEICDIHFALSPSKPAAGGLGIELWGSTDSVQRAKDLVDEWLREYFGAQKDSKWPKIPSLSDAEKARREREFASFAAAQEFRKAPPPDVVFEHMAWFRWPTDIGPTDQLLGRSLEALDPIRTSELCYITYDHANEAFTVLSQDRASVKRTLTRLRAVYFQLVAWRMRAPELYLVVPGGDWLRVILLDEPGDSTSEGSVTPKKSIKCLEFEQEKQCLRTVEDRRQQDLNVANIEQAIVHTLMRLPYYRGNLEMRVRLGKFLLTRYKSQMMYTRDEFMQMMADPQVRGEVTQQYGYSTLIDLKTERLSHPFDSAAKRDKAEVKVAKIIDRLADKTASLPEPSHVVTFIVRSNADWFRLDVEYQGQSESELVCVSQKWSRVESATGEWFHLMDVSLIDVPKSTAWHFEITAGHPIDDKTSILLDRFADGVDLHYFKNEPVPRVFFKRLRMSVLYYQQSVVWRYQFPDCDYMVEFSKLQDVMYPDAQSDPPRMAFTERNIGQLSIAVCARHWMRALDLNAHIGVGERAEWHANLDSFFCPQKVDNEHGGSFDGFPQFEERLRLVENAARDICW